MDLTLSPSEQEFRDELRAWLEENHPGEEPPGRQRGVRVPAQLAAPAARAGLRRAQSWPKEYGGRGATLIEQAIFGEEMVRAKAPSPANVLGLVMGGPVVIAHGSEEQKQRYLEPILSAEEIWCQGFSEPDSGSDLASLKTRAVKSNGDWVVTGQKVWTTFAHEAKWCMLVARTDQDAPKHQGLTYFLMDMEQDAVQVRPLRQITGEAEFNELFIEEARIPDENVVGGVGNGWTVAITTLMHERAGIGAASAASVKIALGQLVELAKRARRGRRPADPPANRPAPDRGRGAAAQRLARPDADHEDRRARTGGLAAQVASGPRSTRRLTELAMEIRGDEGLVRDSEWTYRFLRARANTIEGGTTEILKNIVAERVLGLPKLTMNFDFSDDQQAIKRTAKDFLAARFTTERVRELAEAEEYDQDAWKEICELGWPGIFIGEEHGGQGLGAVELIILMEELGYRWRRCRSCRTRRRDSCSSMRARTSSASAGCPGSPRARRAARWAWSGAARQRSCPTATRPT